MAFSLSFFIWFFFFSFIAFIFFFSSMLSPLRIFPTATCLQWCTDLGLYIERLYTLHQCIYIYIDTCEMCWWVSISYGFLSVFFSFLFREQDVLRFGKSSREFVLLHAGSVTVDLSYRSFLDSRGSHQKEGEEDQPQQVAWKEEKIELSPLSCSSFLAFRLQAKSSASFLPSLLLSLCLSPSLSLSTYIWIYG